MPDLRSLVARGAVVAVASLVLGGLTSFAQGFLPDALSSFANSSSGWTLLTVVLLLWARFRPVPGAVVGAVSFVLLVVGYAVASDLRGFTYSPVLWGVVGVVAGPFIGVATAWLREVGVRAALGTAVLSGVGVGEAVYGLTVIRDSTSPVYWTVVGVLGLAPLGWMLARRIRGTVPIAVAVGGTAVAVGLLLVGYQVIGAVPA